jgi:hypothetical protein
VSWKASARVAASRPGGRSVRRGDAMLKMTSLRPVCETSL